MKRKISPKISVIHSIFYQNFISRKSYDFIPRMRLKSQSFFSREKICLMLLWEIFLMKSLLLHHRFKLVYP